MKVPTEEECYGLMAEYGMLDNIRRHSEQVRNVCLAIADHLKDPGCLNRDLLAASALLHDIAKTRTIATGERRHDTIGGEMMRALGYDEIAYIVEQHVVFENFAPDGPLEEREVVFYADKRVKHDRIVTIEERVSDLAVRYGINEYVRNIIIENKTFIYSIEKKIAGFLDTEIDLAIAGL